MSLRSYLMQSVVSFADFTHWEVQPLPCYCVNRFQVWIHLTKKFAKKSTLQKKFLFVSVNIRLFTTSFLLSALAEDNCCHVENRGGPTLPVLVNIFPVLLLFYHLPQDALELWCWRRPLRVPWTTRGSNQSILKELNPEYLLEELMLKPRLQNFGYLMWRVDSLEKPLMLAKTEDKSIRGQQSMRWLVSISYSMDMNLSKHWETVENRGAWHAAVHWRAELSNWRTTTTLYVRFLL